MKILVLSILSLFISVKAIGQHQLSQTESERLYQKGTELIVHQNFGAARKVFTDFLNEASPTDPRRGQAEYYLAFSALNFIHMGAWFTLGPVLAKDTIGEDGWGLVLSAEGVGLLAMTGRAPRGLGHDHVRLRHQVGVSRAAGQPCPPPVDLDVSACEGRERRVQQLPQAVHSAVHE